MTNADKIRKEFAAAGWSQVLVTYMNGKHRRASYEVAVMDESAFRVVDGSEKHPAIIVKLRWADDTWPEAAKDAVDTVRIFIDYHDNPPKDAVVA